MEKHSPPFTALLSTGFALAWLLSGCAAGATIPTALQPGQTAAGARATQAPAGTQSNSDLNFEQLKNATYTLPDAPGGTITLQGGEGQAPITPDSASQYKAILLSPSDFGDLDGEDGMDAAAVVVADPGGSGSFYYLVALVNQDGKPLHTATVLLGDRIKIKTVSISDGKIQVTYLDRQPGEPFTTEPSLEVIKVFQLQDGQLVEVAQK